MEQQTIKPLHLCFSIMLMMYEWIHILMFTYPTQL